MDFETIFSLANLAALSGWLVLLFGPVLPARAATIPRLIVPALLATAYVALILVGFGDAQGSFATLAGVAALFDDPSVLLAGWLHFLAFDLLVGSFIAQDRARTGLPFWLVIPCLALTFLLGPAGFLLYLLLTFALRASGAQSSNGTDR